MGNVGKAAKAVYAGIVAGLSGLVTVLVGDTTFSNLTAGQWVTIALAVVVAAGGVYGISNTSAGTPPPRSGP